MTCHVRYAFQSASDNSATCFPTALKNSGCSKFTCKNLAVRLLTRNGPTIISGVRNNSRSLSGSILRRALSEGMVRKFVLGTTLTKPLERLTDLPVQFVEKHSAETFSRAHIFLEPLVRPLKTNEHEQRLKESNPLPGALLLERAPAHPTSGRWTKNKGAPMLSQGLLRPGRALPHVARTQSFLKTVRGALSPFLKPGPKSKSLLLFKSPLSVS